MDPNLATQPTAPAPAATSPPPAPTPSTPPASTPTPAVTSPAAGPGSPGVTPGQGTSPAPGLTPAASTPPADWQQQLAQMDQLRRTAQEYEQYRHLIPLGYAAYQNQLGGQPGRTPAPPAQPEAPANPFGLPQFDYRLLDFVGKDPHTGALALQPGAPPDALLRVQEYQAKLQDVQRNFWQDPGKYLAPMIEAKAKEIAQKQYQEQFQGQQQQQTTQQILEQNKGWLYEADAQGNQATRFDPATGRNVPVLSAWGRQYAQYVQQAVQAGVQDPAQQHQMALANLKVLAYEQQARQQAAPAAGQQAAATFLQTQAAAPPSTQPAPSVATPPPAQGKSLREIMRERFNGNGLSDDEVARQVARAG